MLAANSCNACDCFKSNANMFKFEHFSNYNYRKLYWLQYKMKHVLIKKNKMKHVVMMILSKSYT